jgi:phosphatidate cytidylyltransferase
MLTRTFSAIVFVGVFLVLCFAGLLPFVVGVTVLAAIAAWELTAVYGNENRSINSVFLLFAVCVPFLTYVGLLREREAPRGDVSGLAESGLRLLLVLIFVGFTIRATKTGKALGDLQKWYGIFGLGYVGMLFGSFVAVRALPGTVSVGGIGELQERGAWLMLHVAVCVWATDTFAYLVGKAVGKHKLAPSLSPGKTWEGSVGGLIGSILAGAAFSAWIHQPLLLGVSLGLLAGTVGQIGDLFESALKRERGIKDFGKLLPGHGGALDRFDSLLFVTPIASLILQQFEKGMP